MRITSNVNIATAWASAENIAREALEPADEIRAFAQLRATGASIADIATTFGVTEQHVQRRMALADLPVIVLDALKAREISLSAAAAFTVAHDLELVQKVLGHARERDMSARQIRTMLVPDAVRHTDRRAEFVTIAAYEAAGGNLTRDLFSDEVILHNVDLLDQLAASKLETEAQALNEDWKWVEILDSPYASYELTSKMERLHRIGGTLSQAETDRMDELSELAEGDALDKAGQAELEALNVRLDGDYSDEQKAISGWFIFIGQNGDLGASGPWVRKEDRRAAAESGALTGYAARQALAEGEASDTPAPRYTGALVADMNIVQLHSLQGALARNLDLQLDLLAFQLSGEGRGAIYDMQPSKAKIVPDKSDGLTHDPILDDGQKDHNWLSGEELAKAFEAFRAKGKVHRDQALAVGLARIMPHRAGEMFASICELAGAHPRAVWKPTKDGFFSRLKGDALDDLMMELTGLDRSDKRIDTFIRQKKAGKAEGLEELFTCEKVQELWGLDEASKKTLAEWVPDCM